MSGPPASPGGITGPIDPGSSAMEMSRSAGNRRDFLRSSACGAAALSLAAASSASGRVLGANDRIGVAFLGAGIRSQVHIGVINQLKRENQSVVPVAVCDVWDGNKQVLRNG